MVPPSLKTLLESSDSGTVIDVDGLKVKLVIPSTAHGLSMRDGPRAPAFAQWRKILVPCLFCC